MDFFEAQDDARRKSGLLLAYFVTAVLLIIVAVYLTLFALMGDTQAALWDPALFFLAAVGTLLLVGGGTLYKMNELAGDGGTAVAESLGGRRVPRETTDPLERRLLNVVDEMAIASGVPVPPVYVLDAETGINAFAAGMSPGEAVVAVTRGTLEQLTRDELQGVVGHEFSHILNGDMRLNLRLIGVLHGILLLALLGRVLLHGGGRSRGRNAGGAVAFGLSLLLIGYIGVFFGRLIKAAVSRQREYLADAAAVQFTRNPPGIAGALKKIAGVAGSRISHPRAEEASHLFFGEGMPFLFGWFATHPPIEERIRRLDPSFHPEWAALAAPGRGEMEQSGHAALAPHAFAAAAGRPAATHVDYARQLLAGLPESLREAVRQPQGARYVIYALLICNESTAATQLELVREAERVEGRNAVAALREPVAAAGRRARLPLVDMALPALGQLDSMLRERFLRTVRRLVHADNRLDLFEYTLQHILTRRLGSTAAKPRAASHDLQALRADCALLLSGLSSAGNRPQTVERAFEQATALAPLGGPWERLPREAVGLPQLDAALTRLRHTPARFKRRLVEACAAAVITDGKVTAGEGELLRAVCEALEVPMPPLL